MYKKLIEPILQSERYGVVKVSFGGEYLCKKTNVKNIRINFVVGMGVCEKLKWEDGDYINIIKDNGNFILKKEQSKDDGLLQITKSFKLKKIARSYSYQVGMSCNLSRPIKNRKSRTVIHEIITLDDELCLKVFLDSLYEEEKIEEIEGEL